MCCWLVPAAKLVAMWFLLGELDLDGVVVVVVEVALGIVSCVYFEL